MRGGFSPVSVAIRFAETGLASVLHQKLREQGAGAEAMTDRTGYLALWAACEKAAKEHPEHDARAIFRGAWAEAREAAAKARPDKRRDVLELALRLLTAELSEVKKYVHPEEK